MEAKDKSLIEIMNTNNVMQFIIPFFQRSYVWDEENWRTLFDDILEDDEHFLGSIILKVHENDLNKKDVIDGQQRLTTLTILVKAIFDQLSLKEKNKRKDNVKNILFSKSSTFKNGEQIDEYRPRLQHSKFDRDAYVKVIGKVIEDDYGNENLESIDDYKLINDNDHPILKCYKFFREQLDLITDNQKKLEMINTLSDTGRRILVSIDLGIKDDEQAIFDTVNNSGKRLSVADIIKNRLFQTLLNMAEKENISTKKVDIFYEQNWEGLFYKDTEFYNFWNSDAQTGRTKRSHMEILLYCFAMISNNYDPSKDYLNKLNDTYDKILKQFNSYNSVYNFINELIDYAWNYIEIYHDIAGDSFYNKDSFIKRLLLVTKELEVSTFAPLILSIYKGKESKEEKDKKFFELEKFLMKNMLSGLSTKNYNNNCLELLRNYDLYAEKIYYDDRFDKFREVNNLYKLKNKQATLTLFLIELSRINKHDDIQSLQYIYSLEHIMPKSWSDYWKFDLVKGVDENNQLIQDSGEAQKFREKSIGSLGNMTLVTKQFNASLKNKSFKSKILGNGDKLGYKGHGTLKITLEIVENYTNGETIWNEYTIYQRLNKLTDEIENIWFSKQQ